MPSPIRRFLPCLLAASCALAAEPTPPCADGTVPASPPAAALPRMPVTVDPAALAELSRQLPGASPEELAKVLAQIQQHLAGAEADAAAVAEGGSSRISITRSDGATSTTYTIATRDGKPWLVASRNGAEVFSGPVGTPEERALVPEDLVAGAQGLGLDFTVRHQRSDGAEQLEVHSGGGTVGQQTQ